MAARIKLVYPPKNDNIKIEIQQHNKIDEILRRVVNFWIEEGDPDDYALVNKEGKLDREKTLDKENIVGGDELTLVKKSRLGSIKDHEQNKSNDKLDDDMKDSNNLDDVEFNYDKKLNMAEEWLEDNIGVNRDDLNIVESDLNQNKSSIVFSDKKNDCFYTTIIENEKVTRYVPIYENVGNN
ncbi:MAG: hypothetical protein ACOCSL_02450 [Thermoplasmatota archaeon]